MNKNMQAGQLRTKIRIQCKVTTGTGIHEKTEWKDLGTGPGGYIRCCWYPLGGSESWIAQSVQVVDAANVVIRYCSDVTTQCRLIKDGRVYSIIDPTDTDQHRHWIKFKAKAAVTGG